MATSTRTPTAADRLRELLEFMDVHGVDVAAHHFASDGYVVRDGFETGSMLGRLREAARLALHEWEGQA